jgi:hypothetical protein
MIGCFIEGDENHGSTKMGKFFFGKKIPNIQEKVIPVFFDVTASLGI